MIDVTCPGCGHAFRISEAKIRIRCPNCENSWKRKVNYREHVERFDEDDFDPGPRSAPRTTARTATASATGRSNAAPPATAWPLGAAQNGRVTYVSDLSDPAWTGAAAHDVRLAYYALDVRLPQLQGLVIDLPAAQNRADVIPHFAAARSAMNPPKKKTDATEATGEAAAAMTILQTGAIDGTSGGAPFNLPLAGFTMEWGMHLHSGPGLDQIWKRVAAGTTQYLIVEAKGPGAMLSLNTFMPDGFHQMGTRWVMHNLKMHANGGAQVCSDIINDLKLRMATRWPGYDGASKNYYGCVGLTGAAPANVELYGAVVTAGWQADGLLTGQISGVRRYTNFTV